MAAAWIKQHLTEHSILPKEQLALVEGKWGCIHAAIIDQAKSAQITDKGRYPASFGFVDFKNAFDSPSQPLISTVLHKIGIEKGVINLIANLRSKWCVHYEVPTPTGVRKSRGLRIKNGLLQERVRTIWNKELNVTFRQKIKLTNTCVAPIARYYGSMMIIGRGMLVANLHRFDELDAAIRMIIVSEKAKQFNTSKDRVYIHPSSMGYGLTSMKNSVEDSIMYNYMYLMLDDDLSAQRALFKEFVVRNRRNFNQRYRSALNKVWYV
uniref:Reverse transcriptase domain-containing protein n=1 Tax=Ditylenchus dipsaci TaxID=166011 RepID=A0A915ETL1_9BILA